MKNIIIIALAFIAGLFVVENYTLKNKNNTLTNELSETKVHLDSIEQRLDEQIRIVSEKKYDDLLSDWDMFTLALMKVESNYEPTATSSVGAKGYFQITPIYVEEVNRVHKTNYVYEDVVKSFEQSYEVFTLMQEAHNDEYDMDKALKLHNGDHKWYNRRVYKEMANISRYEQMRQMLKDANNTAII
jgi:hypothetical protein